MAAPEIDTSMHFSSVVERVNVIERAILIEMRSELCPNLKATLKHINRHATTQIEENDEEVALSGNKVPHL